MAALHEAPTKTRTIADLLAAHPWPREFADKRRLEWLWTVDVPVAPDVLWPLIADLSRLNRALGLPQMTFVEKDGVRWGSARYTGVKHVWQEVPWNWVSGRWYELFRIYKSGSMRALHGVYELEPTSSGTRVSIYYGVVPRSRIFDLGLKLSFGSMGRAYQRLLPQVAAEAKRDPSSPPCLRPPPPKLAGDAVARLDQLAQALTKQGLDGKLVKQLVDWIASATDDELERIRVRERARVWSIDEDELLRVRATARVPSRHALGPSRSLLGRRLPALSRRPRRDWASRRASDDRRMRCVRHLVWNRQSGRRRDHVSRALVDPTDRARRLLQCGARSQAAHSHPANRAAR
jgi:hypothetical protein